MLASDNDMQNNLITAHPMLAGKKAQNNELTDFSTTEQKSAGLNDWTGVFLLKYFVLETISNGQAIPKANYGLLKSPKKQTKCIKGDLI